MYIIINFISQRLHNFFNTFALLYLMSKGCETLSDPHSVIFSRNEYQFERI